MQQISKTSDPTNRKEPPKANKPKEGFKEIYDQIDLPTKEEKEDLFTLVREMEQEDDDPETLLIHGEGAAPLSQAPPPQVECGGIRLVKEQLDLIEEKMARAILQIKNEMGVETTTIILNPPNPCSVFNGAEIILQKFDTSPFSFNIEFIGEDAGIYLFAEHVEEFVEYFERKHEGLLINRVTASYKQRKEKKAKTAAGVKDGNR